MENAPGKKSALAYLYPPIEPFDRRMFDMGDGHRIYAEQSGNPDGVPVVVVHGGPGGGSSPAMRRYFDPETYRVILFDQRGCGRSKPHADVENNTTWHLVADMEHIRKAFGIDRWIVFGGSWGATLSLIYAQEHPDTTAFLALRGVFLMTKAELDWFYGGGAGQFFPELWEKFETMVPESERDDLIAAYHRRLFSGNPVEEMRFARVWTDWENALASIAPVMPGAQGPLDYAHAFARLENHYFVNGGFLNEDGQILKRVDRIAHIPAAIVQGRYDMICPPRSAWALNDAMPLAEISMIENAGHALSEPGISAALVAAMDRLRDQFHRLGFC
ncbi:MAG: prolyl aminopeptidase [Brevirhabdus sp.]